MKTIRTQRIIAGLLALSGAFFGAIAWVLPVLWPGYVIWFGWAAVAFGQKRWQEKWFWVVSVAWNLALLIFLLFTRGGSQPRGFGQWYPLCHLGLAIALSAYLAIVVPWDTWPENRKA